MIPSQAKAHGVPFFVAAPTTSMDPTLPSGDLIHIELRPESEITHNPQTGAGCGCGRSAWGPASREPPLLASGKRVVVEGIEVWNPSFDVTPGKLIHGVISERGMVTKDRASGDFLVRSFLEGQGLLRADQREVAAGAVAQLGAARGYQELSEASVKGYLSARPLLAAHVGPAGSEGSWSVREVGDGNINYVYIVEGPSGAVAVKQGRPYIRCVGESWPLTQERVRFEAECLRMLRSHCPQHVPEVFHYDERMSLVVMRFIEPPHIILRKGLVAGRVYPALASHVGEYLASTMYHTSLAALGTDKFREMMVSLLANGLGARSGSAPKRAPASRAGDLHERRHVPAHRAGGLHRALLQRPQQPLDQAPPGRDGPQGSDERASVRSAEPSAERSRLLRVGPLGECGAQGRGSRPQEDLCGECRGPPPRRSAHRRARGGEKIFFLQGWFVDSAV